MKLVNKINDEKYQRIYGIAEKRYVTLNKIKSISDDVDKISVLSEFFSLSDKMMKECDNDVDLYNLFDSLYKTSNQEDYETAIVIREEIVKKMKGA